MFFRRLKVLALPQAQVEVVTAPPNKLRERRGFDLADKMAIAVVGTICTCTLASVLGNIALAAFKQAIPDVLSGTTNTLTGGLLSFLVGMKAQDMLHRRSEGNTIIADTVTTGNLGPNAETPVNGSETPDKALPESSGLTSRRWDFNDAPGPKNDEQEAGEGSAIIPHVPDTPTERQSWV